MLAERATLSQCRRRRLGAGRPFQPVPARKKLPCSVRPVRLSLWERRVSGVEVERPWWGKLSCPRCCGVFSAAAEALRCTACGTHYPILGGIPCLLEDPSLFRGLWRARLGDYLHAIEERITALAAEAGAPRLLPATQKRLHHVCNAIASDRGVLLDLFRELVASAQTGAPLLLPGGDPRSVDTPVLMYSELLFRDFVWGNSETAATLDMVRRLASAPFGITAVYGVGTGRLALDVQRELGATHTYGFDIQPLPLLVTARLLRGETVELHEYPLAPNSASDTAVQHRLSISFPAPGNLTLAFADVLRPPLAPGSLDTVITPWFIDAVATDVRETAAAVNRALRPGGVWLNFGPLRFKGSLSHLYAIEEVHELVADSSFELGARFAEVVPYFHSPYSGTHRSDRVFAFAAKKSGEAATVAAPQPMAPWLTDTRLPIPVSRSFVRLTKTSVFTVGVLSLIDGKRSIADIAEALSQSFGVPANTLVSELRPFFARLSLGSADAL